MRDIGILIWVVFLVVGVIGSMVSSIRRQAQARDRGSTGPPQRTAQARVVAPPVASPQEGLVRILQSALQPPSPPPPRTATVRPQPVPQAPRPAPVPVHVAADEHHPPRRRPLFATRQDLVRGVIAAEVFGKPRALRDE